MNSIEVFNEMPKGAKESEEVSKALTKILGNPKTEQEFRAAVKAGNGSLAAQLFSQNGYPQPAGSQIGIVRSPSKGGAAQPNDIHVDCKMRAKGYVKDSNGIVHTIILCE